MPAEEKILTLHPKKKRKGKISSGVSTKQQKLACMVYSQIILK
jgi:hypothetical protein